MKFIGKEKLVSVIEKIHIRVFGHEMSGEMRKFLGNLSWSFFGGMTASMVFFGVSVGAARILGPTEFGKYSLVIAIAEVLLIAVIFGIDIGNIKLLSISSTKKNRSNVITNSSAIVVTTSIIICLISFFSFGFIKHYFNFDKVTVLLIVMIAVIFGIKRVGDSYMRGLMLFKIQAKYKTIEAISVALFFGIAIILVEKSSYIIYIISIAVGSCIVSFLYFKKNIKYISKKYISKKYIKKILSYSIFGIIASMTGVVTQSFDKLFIYKYFELSDVGVYSVYYMLSLLLVSQIIQIVINVFFPSMNEELGKKYIYQKINKLFIISFLPGIVFFAVFIRMALFLFGPEYEIFWSWILILSVFSVIHFFTSLYGWTLISISREGLKKQNIGLIVGTFSYIMIIIVGIWSFGLNIEILFIALVISRLISGLIYKFFIKKML